ncbi:MAG: DNA-3-methyladenine glycosylase [Verrucomicrobiales bacterium]|nr:DNA-3-methyladenine glycosylase [Verrucomicrobiales bacterium]
MPLLTPAFFQRDVLAVARDLVGVELIWRGCGGRIVETEAYAAQGDPACHLVTRPSARSFFADEPAGAAYVYLNYGMHWMLNFQVKGGPRDGLILIRAIEPLTGLEAMRERRKQGLPRHLCSGPGKLAQALGITGEDHRTRMVGRGRAAHSELRTLPRASAWTVVEDVRVGISEAADFRWRFLAADHPCASVPWGRVKPHTPRRRGISRSK